MNLRSFRTYLSLIPASGVAIVAALFAFILLVAGWITNVVWTFQADTLLDFFMGVFGAVFFLIGALHGIYLWF
jgi:hypothetical protein